MPARTERRIRHAQWLVAACALLPLLGACEATLDGDDSHVTINGSIHVPAGQPATSYRAVNGSIKIDELASVTEVSTVNGNITVGAHAQTESLGTVNGGISLGPDVHATEVKTVNGALTVGSGDEVSGSLVNVNGKISVTGAHVGGMIRTVAGDITLSGATKVDGGIRVEKPSGSVHHSDDPTIIIGPGVSVGDLHIERKVRLFVSSRARIGQVSGATAVIFEGDSPPNAT